MRIARPQKDHETLHSFIVRFFLFFAMFLVRGTYDVATRRAARLFNNPDELSPKHRTRSGSRVCFSLAFHGIQQDVGVMVENLRVCLLKPDSLERYAEKFRRQSLFLFLFSFLPDRSSCAYPVGSSYYVFGEGVKIELKFLRQLFIL